MISKYSAIRNVVAVVALLLASVVVGLPSAAAQDVDLVVGALESDGYFLESGAFGDARDFEQLVQEAGRGDEQWYFVSMAGPVGADFSDELRDIVRPTGNVLVYFIDNDGFEVVQLASSANESVENSSLAAFDSNDWTDPEDFMDDVVRDFDRLTASSSSSGSAGSAGSGGSGNTSSGGGSLWPWLGGGAVLVGGGMWFSSRRRRKKDAEGDLETAQKIRAELQTELDELANDVIVLSSPVDLSENDQAIEHYRQATATYTAISDEIPDIETLETLEKADLRQLSELGARVAHARWQMDAAEAIIAGEPIPEKPQIAPPVVETPAPPAAQQRPTARPRNLERRQPRPRVPYSRSRRRSGGGLLDILIAGSGMLGGGRRSSRRSGGGLSDIFGGGSQRTQTRSSRSSGRSRSSGTSRSRGSSGPRSGGGVFGGGSSSRRRSTSRRRSRSSSSRSRSRSSSSRRSTSRRRKRR